MVHGEEVHGELHSTDASSGVAIPLYRGGSSTVRPIAANEYLDIHSVHLVTAAGGDAYVLVGADVTLGNGETVVRGTFAANGGIANELRPHYSGQMGLSPWVVAPAGAVDVIIKGTIRKA